VPGAAAIAFAQHIQAVGHAHVGQEDNMALPAHRGHTDVATEFDRLTQQLSRLFDEEWAALPAVLGGEGFTPLADLEETEQEFILDVDLPGIRKKDVKVEADGRRLVISGERTQVQRKGRLRRQARSWGSFAFEVILPAELDEEHIEAQMEDGVLHVRVPKSTGSSRRRIDVN
jgi:HSP20 family protein